MTKTAIAQQPPALHQDSDQRSAQASGNNASVTEPSDSRSLASADSSSLQWTTAFTHIPAYDPAIGDGDDDAQSTQQNASNPQNNLPAAPMPANGTIVQRRPQTRRILGIIPNFRSVSTDEKLPPQTVRQKFITTTQDSFDYSSAVIPILLAGYNMALKSTPEFGQGMSGYGQYLWHSAVDQTTENYFVEFVFPVLTHEDSRYYTLGRGSFLKRTGYSLSRAVITRSDSGREVFNISEVVGAGTSAALSTAYYPESDRNFSNVASSWGLDVGIDAFTFFLKEFWPDINHSIFHYNEPAQ